MWLLLPTGFVSIVCEMDERNEPTDMLLVRARRRNDLIRFLEHIPQKHRPAKNAIIRTPKNDYPYRVRLDRDALVAALIEAGERITYPNFKSEVARHNPGRSHLYHSVWATLAEIEDEEPKRADRRHPYLGPTRVAR